MHALFHVHCDFDFSFFLLSIISLLIRAGTSILNVFVFLSLNGICSGGIDICLVLASARGHLEVVKYLHEECHADVTDEAISRAKNDEIRRYLQSKR